MPRPKRYVSSRSEQGPGVTGVLDQSLGWNKQALMAWSRKMGFEQGQDPDAVRDQAADIGTYVHGLIAKDIGMSVPKMPSLDADQLVLADAGYSAWHDWQTTMKPHILESEMSLVSEDDEIVWGGTPDALMLIGGDPVLVDFKTSKGVYDEALVQVAAYLQLVERQSWLTIEKRWRPSTVVYRTLILHLDKSTGEFTEHCLTQRQLDVATDVWWHCLGLYRLQRAMQEVRNGE